MIVELTISLLAVATFGITLWMIRILPVARAAVSATMLGLSAVTDRELDDDAKEVAVRRAGFALLGAAASIAARFCVALVIAALPVLLADVLGVADAVGVIALVVRLDYILAVSAAAIVVAEGLRRLHQWRAALDATVTGKTPQTAPRIGTTYSTVDRLIHGLAFSSPAVLRAASRIEDSLLGPSPTFSGPPIFVTSLARGGTTAILNALSRIPGVATHTYRDMPFLTAPLLWDRLAGSKQRRVEERARAHGDGLIIDLDSPEAFEEVIWKMFWPEKFSIDRIALWTDADRRPEAERFLARHMAKIVRARLGRRSHGPARYCSKNNTNIARLSYLPHAFPGARVVVLLRRPESHAASLLRQHQNFLALQAEDDFVRRYMRDIGHFEFGLIHRPMAFPGFDPARHHSKTADYWLDYWVHAFREVEARLKEGQELDLVAQDDLRERPQEKMQALAERLGLEPAGQNFASYFLTIPDRGADDAFDSELLAEARNLYERLAAHAL